MLIRGVFADERNYYRQQTKTAVPLKWMAPETVQEAKYTSKSDVWAFGVLGYEVTSLGMTPYGALGGQELMAELERGYRLQQPPQCPPNVFPLLLQCWQMAAEARPSFAVLLQQLKALDAAHAQDTAV